MEDGEERLGLMGEKGEGGMERKIRINGEREKEDGWMREGEIRKDGIEGGIIINLYLPRQAN